MAILKYGSLVSEIRGKLNNSIFQRCGQTLSIRNNPSKLQVRNPFGQNSRNNMSAVSSVWRSLSSNQRTAWLYAAPTYPTFDRFGVATVLTAYQLFVYVNKPLALAGYGLITDAINYNPPVLTNATFEEITPSSNEFFFSADAPLPNNCIYMFYMSYPMPLGASRQNYQAYYLGSYDDTLEGGVNLWSSLSSGFRVAFGQLATYSIEIWLVNTSDGQMILENSDLFDTSNA